MRHVTSGRSLVDAQCTASARGRQHKAARAARAAGHDAHGPIGQAEAIKRTPIESDSSGNPRSVCSASACAACTRAVRDTGRPSVTGHRRSANAAPAAPAAETFMLAWAIVGRLPARASRNDARESTGRSVRFPAAMTAFRHCAIDAAVAAWVTSGLPAGGGGEARDDIGSSASASEMVASVSANVKLRSTCRLLPS